MQNLLNTGSRPQPLGSKIGLHGGWFDHDTGRIYYRQRVYDPIMARFLSRDPLGVWGADVNLGNSYCFVANGPTIWRDPDGLEPVILVTSFKPWREGQTNSSQTVASAVSKSLLETGAKTQSLTIDVDWKTAQNQMKAKIEEIKKGDPKAEIIVIGLGMGGGFQLETVARNGRARIPDVNGFVPTLEADLVNNSKDPKDAKREAPRTASVVAKTLGIATSKDAGRYLCDACAYEIYSQVDSGAIESGFFIHVPGKPTDAQIQDFAKKTADLFGPKGGYGLLTRPEPPPGKPEQRERPEKPSRAP